MTKNRGFFGVAMETKIRFGTDGWRGLIAHDFTFENVARCAQGVCDYLTQKFSSRISLVVGYDTRFLSQEFAEAVAKVCAANGLIIYLSMSSLFSLVLKADLVLYSKCVVTSVKVTWK